MERTRSLNLAWTWWLSSSNLISAIAATNIWPVSFHEMIKKGKRMSNRYFMITLDILIIQKRIFQFINLIKSSHHWLSLNRALISLHLPNSEGETQQRALKCSASIGYTPPTMAASLAASLRPASWCGRRGSTRKAVGRFQCWPKLMGKYFSPRS